MGPSAGSRSRARRLPRPDGRRLGRLPGHVHPRGVLALGRRARRAASSSARATRSEFDLRTGDVLSPAGARAAADLRGRVEAGELEVRLAPPPVAAEARARARGPRPGDGRPRRDHGRAVRSTGSSLDDVDLTDLDAWEEGVPYAWLDAVAPRGAALLAGRGGRPRLLGRSPATTTSSQVSKDWATYSSETGGTSLEDLTPAEVEARKSMLDTDPPAHTRLRALVNKGFTPRVVNTYEERIRGLARGILAQRVRAGRVRLGGGRRRRDADVGVLRDHGPARRGPAAPDRARRQAARQHRPRGRRRGEPSASSTSTDPYDPAAARSRARSRPT